MQGLLKAKIRWWSITNMAMTALHKRVKKKQRYKKSQPRGSRRMGHHFDNNVQKGMQRLG